MSNLSNTAPTQGKAAGLEARAAGLAADPRSLAALKRDARADPQGATRAAANQFEQVFVRMLLKSMRDATPNHDPLAGPATQMSQGLLDEQWAQSIASRGIGLSAMIEKQLSRTTASAAAVGASRGAEGTARGAEGTARGAEGTARSAEGTPRGRGEKGIPLPAAGAPRENAQRFIDTMMGPAQEASRATGLPPAFILGQAALESGWGRREIVAADGSRSFNLFGIKAGSHWKGASVEAKTTEYVDGQAQKSRERFRAYASYEEAFADYARLLNANPRYAEALAQKQDAGGFARAMSRAGYATDPAYADKLARTIRTTLSVSA